MTSALLDCNHDKGLYVDSAPRRPYGTHIRSCSGDLLVAAGIGA
jgi:hypothetical protein